MKINVLEVVVFVCGVDSVVLEQAVY